MQPKNTPPQNALSLREKRQLREAAKKLIQPMIMQVNVSALLGILLLILFFSPVIFQLVFGLKALRGKVKLKFWVISGISIIVQILATTFFLLSMSHSMKERGINDGLGQFGVYYLGIILVIIIIIITLSQMIIYRITRKNSNQTL